MDLLYKRKEFTLLYVHPEEQMGGNGGVDAELKDMTTNTVKCIELGRLVKKAGNLKKRTAQIGDEYEIEDKYYKIVGITLNY